MSISVAERTTEDRGRIGAHRSWGHPDADGGWSCWDCGETTDTLSGLKARDDCPGSQYWCSMCRRQRHSPDYECECSLSGLAFDRCGIYGRWELEPEAMLDGEPVCRACESSPYDVGSALDVMLAEARASRLPIQQHAEAYVAHARAFTLAIPEDDDSSLARGYAAAFEAAAEALDGLAQLDTTVDRVRMQCKERRS